MVALFFSALFAYSCMMVRAPRFTLLASAVFGSIVGGLYLFAYLALEVRAFG